jgi:hypothetical protein
VDRAIDEHFRHEANDDVEAILEQWPQQETA